MKRQLTDRFCANARIRPGEPQTDYFDANCPGLALRVSGRKKSWTFHYSLNGTRKRLTFGAYPSISLNAARTRADEARMSVSEGTNPQPTSANSLKAICETYMQREGNRLRSGDWVQGVLARHIYPALGPRPIAEIRRSEIVGLLDRIEEESGPVMSDKTFGIIRRVLNWHAARSDDFHSPIVRGMARTKGPGRDRILTDDELRQIWCASAGIFGDYVRFLLLTAARRTEVAEMQWSEIAGSDWLLPASRNKTGLDLLRPLSPAALALLPTRNEGLVWGMARGGFAHRKQQLDAASGTSGWTIHDIRRTSRSLMSRAGVPSDHAERCLGHVIGGVRGVYDRHEYHAEKQQAYDALAGIIERIVSGTQAGVVQLRGKR